MNQSQLTDTSVIPALPSLEQGFLVCVQGLFRGEVFPLGESGLVLTTDFEWLPRERARTGILADLYKVGSSVYLDGHSSEVRIGGDVAKVMTPVPCNANIEVGFFIYRLFYFGPNAENLKRKEKEIRPPSFLSGLFPGQREVKTDALGEILQAISPSSRACLEQHWPNQDLNHCLNEYLRNPLSVVRAQNSSLRQMTDSPARQSSAKELLLANAEVEAALFPSSERKTPDTYDELTNVHYLAQNDYLPGHRFVLGDESTYNREKLCVDKVGGGSNGDSSDRSLINFFVDSRIIGIEKEGDEFRQCLQIFFSLVDQFAPGPVVEGGEFVTINLQNFFDQGGVCRHKCAVLQVALQEAGIPSRYLRGKLFFGGYHAWIEADILHDGSYMLILDPHLYHVLLKTEIIVSPGGEPYLVDEGYPVKPTYNTIWRGKPKI